jgi:hypothetical protein
MKNQSLQFTCARKKNEEYNKHEVTSFSVCLFFLIKKGTIHDFFLRYLIEGTSFISLHLVRRYFYCLVAISPKEKKTVLVFFIFHRERVK